MAQAFKFPKFRNYLHCRKFADLGLVESRYYRYKAGQMPGDFVSFLQNYPVAALDLTSDLVNNRLADKPETAAKIAAVLDLVRSELAAALGDSAEYPKLIRHSA